MADASAPTPKKKRKKTVWPKERSMTELRSRGFIVADVEKWMPPRGNMKMGIRRDVFGFGDLLVTNGRITYLVQCCSGDGGSFAEHKRKIVGPVDEQLEDKQYKAALAVIRNAEIWKAGKNAILLHGWRKQELKGQRAKWILREELL